jgi:hypothetical protein
VQVVCPNCGAAFEINIDPDDTKFVIDCEVCCRPMTISVRLRDGEIDTVDVSPA